jgi:hypothetical protein
MNEKRIVSRAALTPRVTHLPPTVDTMRYERIDNVTRRKIARSDFMQHRVKRIKFSRLTRVTSISSFRASVLSRYFAACRPAKPPPAITILVFFIYLFPPFKQPDFRKIWNFINEQIGYRNSPSTNPI